MNLQSQDIQPGRAASHPRARKARASRSGNRPPLRAGRRRKSRSVAELERMIGSLERQIAELTRPGTIRSTISGASDQVGQAAVRASNQVGELVADSLSELAGRMRGSATTITTAARVGTSSLQRIGIEMERRPLMTVAIALAIGFLAAAAGRREAA